MRLAADNSEARRMTSAAEWCLCISGRGLLPPEQDSFEEWLAADPLNRQAFDEAVRTWHAVELVRDAPELASARAEALEEFECRAGSGRQDGIGWRMVAAIAASLVMAIMAGTWLNLSSGFRLETGVGERRYVVLADKSAISLDAGTLLQVDLNGSRRDLRLLSGRAKFDVAPDPARPFTVTAANRTVIATGTSFSVEKLGSEVRVILYEGHVRVVENDRNDARPDSNLLASGRAAYSLQPRQELVLGGDHFRPSLRPLQNDSSAFWETGELSFDEEPLGLAVERLNRYSNEKLLVADPRTARIKINGVFKAGDSKAFIEGITSVYPVSVTHEAGRATLRIREKS